MARWDLAVGCSKGIVRLQQQLEANGSCKVILLLPPSQEGVGGIGFPHSILLFLETCMSSRGTRIAPPMGIAIVLA